MKNDHLCYDFSLNAMDRLPAPPITLPIAGPAPERRDPELVRQLYQVGSATLHKMGLRQTFIEGPTSRLPGSKVVGPAVTPQFMPQREDVASGAGQEGAEQTSALWHVFDSVQTGDVLVVQAYGDPYTGCPATSSWPTTTARSSCRSALRRFY